MRSRTHVLIAFFSAMAVTLVAVSDMRRTSPGGLSAVHQRLPELAGKNDCSECHGGLFGTLREACLECHEPIEAQLQESTGLHGTLGARAEQCGLCHAEHHGAAAPLVHGQSFALAGVAKVAEFDHALIGFTLDGAHRGLDCVECHANASIALLPEGETRFLGLERDCASCHEDAHEGRRVLACSSCHGQERWEDLFALGHERVLPLTGGHALACAECHEERGPHALETLGEGKARAPARDCVACHESPHAAEFDAGVAGLVHLAPGLACGSCHVPEDASFHEQGLAARTPGLHAASGFALEAPHDAVACEDCHAPEEPDFDARYPGRAAGQCSACHADVHEGQFETGPFASLECTACHDPLHFEPAAFGPEEHARTAFDLTGKHLEVGCEGCHRKPSEDAARAFRGTPSDCDACHEDAHGGAFTPFLGKLPPVAHGACEGCHDTLRFANAGASFDHATFTGFAVRGAHAQSECAACHAASNAPDPTGRTFGRVAELFGRFEGCSTCHADPHFGFFDLSNGFPAEVEGRSDCARCHVENTFRSLRRAFDHGYWTGFALLGPHADSSCSACHRPMPGPDRSGRTVAEAAGSGCADCHENPHGRQFADEFGATDCARCHASEPESLLVFDHERDARFALGDAHRALPCDACHKTEQRAGLSVLRFRPLGSDCTDCHGSNAEVLLRRQPRRK